MNMLKRIFLLLLTCFFLLFIIQCKKEKKIAQLQSYWSANDPLTIPYRLRIQLFNKGNLMVNPSFEQGRMFNLDSVNTAFNLPGWQKVGDNVKWVNSDGDSLFNRQEVNSGIHAIKISRNIAGMTQNISEGIKSDFIKVIPGDYKFSFYVKLKDVKSFYKNYGNLKDVLDIRIEYYDKNKIELNTSVFDPDIYSSYNIHHDLYYSSLSCIKDFNWGEVSVGTHQGPGKGDDMPDEARFVKIFIGFKGRGNVWIDDVSLKLTKWNFSYLERFKPFFDSVYTPYDLLIPQPKTMIRRKPRKLFVNDSNRLFPAIIIPVKADKITMDAANLLKEELVTLIQDITDNEIKIPLLYNVSEDDINNYSLLFSVGKTNMLNDGNDSLSFGKINDKEQGYIIKQADNRNVIYLAGYKPQGNYYAVTTLVQLFNNKDLMYHHADIIDYPSFYKRPFVFSLSGSNENRQIDFNSDAAKLLLKHKLNFVYFNCPLSYNDVSSSIDRQFLNDYRSLSSVINDNSNLSSGLIFEFPLESIKEVDVKYNNNKLSYHLPYKELIRINHFKRNLQYLISSHVEHVTIIPDKFDYSLVFPDENDSNDCIMPTDFNTLPHAHTIMVNHLYYWLKNRYPKIRLQFCSPWYCNKLIELSQGKGKSYFNTVMPNFYEDINLLWTGSESFTYSLDDATIEEYQRITGRVPLLLNNMLGHKNAGKQESGIYSYHQKAILSNVFQSYDVDFPDNFYDYNSEREILVNTFLSDELDKIKYLTIASYLWNSNDYNADLALWKSLITLYGKEKAMELIAFNDEYYNIKKLYFKLKHKKDPELFQLIPRKIALLDQSYDRVVAAFGDSSAVVKDLEMIKQDIIIKINRMENNTDKQEDTNIDSTIK